MLLDKPSSSEKDLINLRSATSSPSFFLHPISEVTRFMAKMGFILVYFLTKFALVDYLPAKWFVDSEKMYRIMDSGGDQGGSFAITAKILTLIPTFYHDLLVAFLGVVCIVQTFSAIKTRRGLIAGIVVLPPLLLLGLLVPSKETLVVLMSLVILMAFRKAKSLRWPFLGIIIMYSAYGLAIREYYLLILLVWIGFQSMTRMHWLVTLSFCLLCFAIMFFLPPTVFHTLQGSRDTVFAYTLSSPTVERNTAFANPFPPVSAIAFWGNYAYTFLLLHFPFFHFFGIKEMLLFANILFYAWLMTKGWRLTDKKVSLLSQLFAAHVVILWLFEPDLGSYFRHFSSVYLFLIPSFAALEEKSLKQKEPSPYGALIKPKPRKTKT